MKDKLYQVDFINNKTFCVTKKNNTKRMKRQATDGEKYVQVIYLTKNLYLECVKSAENSSRKSVILAQMGKKKKTGKKPLH